MAAAQTGLSERGRALALVLSFLSVLFLANAPIQSALMVTGQADGPLCSVHTEQRGSSHQTPADRRIDCASCAVCHLGGLAIPTAAGPVLPEPLSSSLATVFRPSVLNPRGPPRLAAYARGPPTLS